MTRHEGGDLISAWISQKGERFEVRQKAMYGPNGRVKFIYKGKYDATLAETFLFKWAFTKIIGDETK